MRQLFECGGQEVSPAKLTLQLNLEHKMRCGIPILFIKWCNSRLGSWSGAYTYDLLYVNKLMCGILCVMHLKCVTSKGMHCLAVMYI